MDLFNYTSDKANVATDIVIKHPVTGADTDIVIQVVGLDSTAAQECLDKQQAIRFAEMTASGDMSAPAFDPKQNREQMLELLCACTKGWKHVEFDGAQLEFTKENVLMVYEKVPAIRDQVNKATGSRKLFFKD
jgi:hypothetical protein